MIHLFVYGGGGYGRAQGTVTGRLIFVFLLRLAQFWGLFLYMVVLANY